MLRAQTHYPYKLGQLGFDNFVGRYVANAADVITKL